MTVPLLQNAADWISQRSRFITAAGAILLLLAWYLATEKLQQQVAIQAEQRWADASSWMLSNMSSLSAQLQAMSSKIELLHLRVDPPSPSPGRPRLADTSLALRQVGWDLKELNQGLTIFGALNLDRAQNLMLQAATLPARDSIVDDLGSFLLLHLMLRLKVDSLTDSLAALTEVLDRLASSRLPAKTSSLSVDQVAAWGGAEVARLRNRIDSATAVLDRYEKEIPSLALDHQALTQSRLNRYRWAVLLCYVLGSVLVLLGQFSDRPAV